MAKKKAAPRKSTKKKATKKKATGKKVAKKKPSTKAKKPEPTKEMRHYEEIVLLNEEARTAWLRWDEAKHTAKELKEAYDAKRSALSTLIAEGPDPQSRLPFGEDGDEAGGDKKSGDGKAPSKPQPAWMARPLGVLGIAKGLIRKLEENGIETIGQLHEYWQQGRVLHDLQGIAAEKSASIADAWAEYAKDHQEVYGLGDDEDEPLMDPPEDHDEDE